MVGGRKYKIVTAVYVAQGNDRFSMLTKGNLLMDHESGASMSSIVRKYMLGRIDILMFKMVFRTQPMDRFSINSTREEGEGGHRYRRAEAKGGTRT